MLQFDGKGVVMRPEGLRPATAKAAAARQKLATRLSPGEKNGRKRMAELAAVHDAVPVARTPADVLPPARPVRGGRAESDREVADRLGHRRPRHRGRRRLRRGRAARPAPPAHLGRARRRQQLPARRRHHRGRTLRRRDPHRHRLHPRARIPVEGGLVVLRDRRPRRRGMVTDKARRVLAGRTSDVATGLHHRASYNGYNGYNATERKGADTAADYLNAKAPTSTTPPPSRPAGRSPPASSSAPAATSPKTEWTSPARDGDSTAPKASSPSAPSAPSSPTATSRTTGSSISTRNATATTTASPRTITYRPDQLTSRELHPSSIVGT
ncbi:hypothetical protein FRAHR75_680021 [Frankia sp. Hr75.2]|nr:hypothetical protein FRAHR75_680021 [Frankia sp. Hr75.2]